MLRRHIAIGALLSVVIFAGAVAASPTAEASCPVNVTSSYVYIPNGNSNFSVTYAAAFFVSGSIVFNPGLGSYQLDTWSSGFDNYGSTTYWYFSYHKVSNAGNAYLLAAHC